MSPDDKVTLPLPGPADTTAAPHPLPAAIGRFVVKGWGAGRSATCTGRATRTWTARWH